MLSAMTEINSQELEHDLNAPTEPPMAGESTSNFTLFPKLPPELRLEIWRLSIPKNRVVRIIAGGCVLDPPDAHVDEQGNTEDGRYCFRTQSTETIPALLHTSRESRAEGLKMYSLCLATRLIYPVYFNFTSDFVLLRGEGDFRRFHRLNPPATNAAQELEEFHSNLRHLIIAEDEWRNHFHVLLLHDISEFRNLKTLIFPKFDENRGLPHENAVRSWLHEVWTSDEPFRKRVEPGGNYPYENWRIQQDLEHEQLWSWLSSVDDTVDSGKEIPPPPGMETEVLFMDLQEIEAMLVQPMP